MAEHMWPEKEHARLLEVAEKIEDARAKLDDAIKAVRAQHVSVTDPLASALTLIDASLEALDIKIGAASRQQYRSRPRAADAIGRFG